MLDPQQAFALATKSLLVPTTSGTPSIGAPPTVLPDHTIHQQVGDSGKTVLWVVFIVMLVSSAAFSLLAWTIPLNKRLFHFVTALITIFASLSYFAMATGAGIGIHETSKTHHHKHGLPDTVQTITRQVYWARYVDWALTTPLLLLDLGLLAGISGGHIIIAIIADIIMVLTGLFAAFPDSKAQKWGWYAIACVAFLVVIWHLAINGRKAAKAQGRAGTLYNTLALYTILVWTAYPIIWGVSEGSRILSVNGEIVAYAILDILAKPVFGFWLLIAHRALDDVSLDVGGFWTNGLSGGGSVRLEDDDGA